MKRIAILATLLALFTTGAALAGTQPPDGCICPTAQTQNHGLTGAELAP